MWILNKKEVIKLVKSMPDDMVFWADEEKDSSYLENQYLLKIGSDYYNESIDT